MPESTQGAAARSLKQLNDNAIAQQNIGQFFLFLDFLAGYSFKKQNQTIPANLIKNASQGELKPAFSTSDKDDGSIHKVYESEIFNQYILPGDIVALLRDALLAYRRTYFLELKQARNENLLADFNSVLNRIQQSYTQHWPNNKISKDQELSLVKDVIESKEVKDLVLAAKEVLTQAQQAIHPETLSEKGVQRQEKSRPSGTAVVAPLKPAEAKPEAAEGAPQEESPTKKDRPEFINQDLQLLATSFTYSALGAVLAAYATDENGEPLVSISNLSEPLRQSLISHIRPQVENIIVNLNPAEINALINNAAEASAVKAKILRQTHSYILRTGAPSLLIQQAFNERFEQLGEAQDKDLIQQLQNSLEANGHQQAAQQLEKIAGSSTFKLIRPPTEDPVLSKQAASENQIEALRKIERLSTNYQEAMARKLGLILDIDPTQVGLHQININRSLSSLFIADPTLPPDFIDQLGYSQFRILFGDFVSREQFAENQKDLKKLFKEYWVFYRADLNRTSPQLRALSDYASQRGELGEEKIEEKILETASVRSRVFTQTKLTEKEAVKELGKGLADESDEGKDKDYVDQLKLDLWKQLSLEEKQHYLKEVGVAERLYLEKTREEVSKLLQEQQLEFDLFTHYLLETQRAQAEAVMGAAAVVQQQQGWRAALQMQAVLSSSNFLTPQQNIYLSDGSATTYSPPSTQQALQKSQLLGGLAKKGLDFAAEQGGRAALNAITGGSYEAVRQALPPGLRKQLDKITGKGTKGVVAIGAGAVVGLAGFLISMFKRGLVIGASSLGGAVAGGIAGFSIGGPVGAIIGVPVGALGGGGIAIGVQKVIGKLSGGAAGFGKSVSNSLQQGVGNISNTTSGLGRRALGKTGLNASVSNFFQNAGQAIAEGAGAAQAGIAEFFTGNIAAQTVAAYTGVTAASTFVVMTMSSAFQINLPLQPGYLTVPEESRYVKVSKTVQITNQGGSCQQDNICNNPSFPIEVEYTILIEPKNNHVITINQIKDTVNVIHNEEKYQEEGLPVPSIPDQTRNGEDLGLDLPITLDLNDNNPDTNQLDIKYTASYDEDYNHANIKNKMDLNFSHQTIGGGFAPDTTSTLAMLRLGEYPEPELCWPASGAIVQGPYHTYSHQQVDAYDVVPRDYVSGDLSIYAPTNGELCPGRFTSGAMAYQLLDPVYGEHVSLKTEINGETYVFVFGHLVTGSALVRNTCQDVIQGEVIGEMGNTGKSDGIHLHFERRAGYLNSLTLTELMTQSSIIIPNGTAVNSCAEI